MTNTVTFSKIILIYNPSLVIFMQFYIFEKIIIKVEPFS